MPPLSPESKHALKQQITVITKRLLDAQEATKHFEKAKEEAQRAIDRIAAEVILFERAKDDLLHDLGEAL